MTQTSPAPFSPHQPLAEFHQYVSQMPVLEEEGRPKYHQVFVTANSVLRQKVRKNFFGLKLGMHGPDVAMVTEYPPTLKDSDIQEHMFPLFCTLTEFLDMLDGTFDEPFFPRNQDGSLKYEIKGE